MSRAAKIPDDMGYTYSIVDTSKPLPIHGYEEVGAEIFEAIRYGEDGDYNAAIGEELPIEILYFANEQYDTLWRPLEIEKHLAWIDANLSKRAADRWRRGIEAVAANPNLVFSRG